MDTIVMKFGGSSVADNIRLNQVAEKVIELYNQNNNIIVVVSAQGKTTDNLIKKQANFPADQVTEKWTCYLVLVNKLLLQNLVFF